MELNQLFQVALGINSTWYIETVQLNDSKKNLEIKINFTVGAKFPCPNCKSECTGYDTQEKRWQHLNFFNYCCYLSARIPRVKCNQCGKTRQVETPFAREGSGFSLLLECMMLQLAKIMPVNEVAKLFNISDDRVWTAISNSLRIASIYKQLQRNPSDFAKMNSFAKINQLGIIMP